MSEGKQYIPDQFAGREFKAASVTQAKVSTKLYKTSSSDPAASDDTGLGYAVGTIWTNTTSGQVFICSDASAEDAVWYGQEGDIINEPFKVEGSTYGYHHMWSDPGAYPGVIDRFPFASGGASSDHGESGTGSYSTRGSMRTSSHAYNVGWFNNSANRNIHRFSFTAPSGTEDVGEHSNSNYQADSASATDGTYGWVMGGATSPGADLTDIEKFTMASPAPSAATGATLAAARKSVAGVSDIGGAHMYSFGGQTGPPPAPKVNTIERGAFSISSGNLTDHGDLSAVKHNLAGTQNPTHGYSVGGSPALDVIEKFEFGSGDDASDVGNLVAGKKSIGACASTTHGHKMGGSPPMVDTIDRFSFSSDADAADFGELSTTAQGGSGVEN